MQFCQYSLIFRWFVRSFVRLFVHSVFFYSIEFHLYVLNIYWNQHVWNCLPLATPPTISIFNSHTLLCHSQFSRHLSPISPPINTFIYYINTYVNRKLLLFLVFVPSKPMLISMQSMCERVFAFFINIINYFC